MPHRVGPLLTLIWIAAQAIETGAALVSLDRHFDAVDGLALAPM